MMSYHAEKYFWPSSSPFFLVKLFLGSCLAIEVWPLDADCSKDKVMQIFGKNLVQFSRNLGKMIWWHSKQKEKWESQNKLFSCVSSLVLTITSFTQRNLFCHQWILIRFRDRKSTSFQKTVTKLNLFFASIPQYTSTPLRVVSISVVQTKWQVW